MKPRIALFAASAVGGGKHGQGAPVLVGLFERLSHHYEIVLYSFTRVKAASAPDAICVRKLSGLPLPAGLKHLLLLVRSLADHIRNPYHLIFSVSVYPNGIFALLMARLVRRKILVQLIASEAVRLEEFGCGQLVKKWPRRVTWFVCRHADLLVTVADFQRRVAVTTLRTKRAIEMLPLRIDPGHFNFNSKVLAYPIQFVHVAYYSPLKDQDTLFRAFALVASKIECTLTVVGDGFETQEVTDLLGQLGIVSKVTLAGFVPHSDLHAHYNRSHVLLHTARFETGCAVIQEAMASGVAVCGTDVGLLADLGNRHAMVAPAGNPEQLAEQILSLVNDPVAYRRMTTEAYGWICRHSATWAANNYHHFIADQIGQPRD